MYVHLAKPTTWELNVGCFGVQHLKSPLLSADDEARNYVGFRDCNCDFSAAQLWPDSISTYDSVTVHTHMIRSRNEVYWFASLCEEEEKKPQSLSKLLWGSCEVIIESAAQHKRGVGAPRRPPSPVAAAVAALRDWRRAEPSTSPPPSRFLRSP
jgi:hypothetical protein